MKFDIKQTLNSSLRSSILILKLIVPLYIFADILLYLGWLDYISFIFEPITTVLNLPSETALALAVGVLLNIYAAIAFAAPLGLTPYEWTILGVFLGICHSMLVESAIMKKLGISYKYSFLLRGSVAFLAVILLYFMPKNWFSTTAILSSNQREVYVSFADMLQNSAYGSLVLSVKVIILIVTIIFLMDLIKTSKIVQEYQKKVSTSFSIVVGLILGITYGAGILINEAKSGALSKKDIFFIATFLMICHSVIEDTLLFVIFGANYWILIVIRLIFAIIFSYLLVKIYYKETKDKIATKGKN
jgi:hypothetical protein